MIDDIPRRPVAAASPPAAPPALSLRGLTKTYGPVRAVDGLDLTIGAGEIVAVLGPNGAGKSTTNELVLGLVRPDAGDVRVFGLSPRAAVQAGRVGAMLQAGALLQDTRTVDLLRLMHGLHRRPLPLAEVVERADVSSFLRTKTDRLSGGQAQRLRYALAIMPDPHLLVLDEPTVGMDVEIRRGFWASMRDFVSTGRTVCFATHYLEEVDDVADRVVVLAAGRVVADGTGAEIRSRVAGRRISVAADSLTAAAARALPAVTTAEVVGSRLRISSRDSDATLRTLLRDHSAVRDVEVTSARLEDAFVSLTSHATHLPEEHR